MPIISNFSLPKSASDLDLAKDYSAAPLFITFISSKLPETGEAWCPDVRAAMPVLESVFSAPGAPAMAFVEVGQLPQWRDPKNKYRTVWNVHNVPTLVKYSFMDGEIQETGRLVEGDVLGEKRLRQFINKK
ncbi:unnamed protein product [Discula destructiva]